MSELQVDSRNKLAIGAVALIAMAIRLCFFGVSGTMTDPDDYGKYAAAYANGQPGPDGNASAFRPPVYPMLLVPFIVSNVFGQFPIAFLHAAISALLIIFTYMLSRKMGLNFVGSLTATLLVAINPQLIFLSTQLMTEPLFAVELVALLFYWRTGRPILTGFLAGVGILTRPTMLALWIAVGIYALATRQTRNWVIASVCATLVCTPWVARNAQHLGSPVLTTTHGGYTVWLGMNPSFYHTEVVEGRNWAFTDEFKKWEIANQELLDTYERTNQRHHAEIVRDQAYKQFAIDWIRANPTKAIHSAWYHIKSFWAVVPRSGPEHLRPIVAGFYIGLFLLALIGIWQRRRDSSTWLLVVLIVSLTLVHAVFWSNMRMRAPIEPILAIFAGNAIEALVNGRFKEKTIAC